jgi:hypothetical protein
LELELRSSVARVGIDKRDMKWNMNMECSLMRLRLTLFVQDAGSAGAEQELEMEILCYGIIIIWKIQGYLWNGRSVLADYWCKGDGGECKQASCWTYRVTML